MTNGEDMVYPQTVTEWHEGIRSDVFYGGGLTKREHFAAMAMQGILANGNGHINTGFVDIASSTAVAFADGLIEALNKGSNDDAK